jgi:hypothetical protein
MISGAQLLPKKEQMRASPVSSNVQPELIAKLCREVILLSMEAGDDDSLPYAETLQAVEDYQLLLTDQNGWIELSTDGERLWVEAEKK